MVSEAINHKLFQCVQVLFDPSPPSRSVDGSTALQSRPPFPQIVLLSSWIGDPAYKRCYVLCISQPRKTTPTRRHAHVIYAPNPISFLVNNGLPMFIIHCSVLLPPYRDILYTISEETRGSNTIAVEFAYGKHHDTRLDDRQIYLCQGHFLNLEGVLLVLRIPKPPVG